MNRVVIGETLRRNVTNLGYVTAVLLIGIVAFFVSRFDKPGSVWGSFLALLALVVGSRSIGPEFSTGTLQLILTKPVNRSSYLLSRVAGAALAVSAAATVAFTCELLGRAIWSDAVPLKLLSATLLNTCVDLLLMCALLALFGSFTRAYFNVAIYVALTAGLSVLQGLLGMARMSRGAAGRFLTAHPSVERAVAMIDVNLFPDPPQTFDRDWLLLVLSNTAMALVLACFFFRNREVPYGAD